MRNLYGLSHQLSDSALSKLTASNARAVTEKIVVGLKKPKIFSSNDFRLLHSAQAANSCHRVSD